MSARRRRQHERRRGKTAPPALPPSVGVWSDAARAELLLLRRAIREGWPVPAARRPGILAEALTLARSADERLTLAAVRVFIDADRVSLGRRYRKNGTCQAPTETESQGPRGPRA